MASVLETSRAAEFLGIIRERLPERTVRHSIATAELMESLADDLGITLDQVAAAGLLHDLCKDLNGTAFIEAARRYGVPVTQAQRTKPSLLHGPIAAEMVRRDLGVTDDAVYEAIRWHTTGYPGLGPLGLALYFADWAEPFRRQPGAAEARAILETDGFMRALRYVARHKWDYVQSKPIVDPTAQAFCRWLETVPD